MNPMSQIWLCNFRQKVQKKRSKYPNWIGLVYSSFPAKFREERLMQESFTQSVLSIELLISYLGGYFFEEMERASLKGHKKDLLI